MTTKRPLRKQVIILINLNNSNIIGSNASFHINDINRYLKDANSNNLADFIHIDKVSIIITTRFTTSEQNMRTIEKAIKNDKKINKDSVKSPCLPQSKSYLKILELPYFVKNMNEPITSQIVKEVLKKSHIFENIKFSLKPWVIKASPNFDSAVIWVDIWNSQEKLKSIINWQFNVGSFIATICDTRVSSGIPQCKNCWKWGHLTFRCQLHMTRCVLCYSLYKTEHYRNKSWYCKANNKSTPPRLTTKDSKPCPHSFKYVNCKSNHQANSNKCPYWCNHFNKEWHSRKQQELSNSRA